MAWWTWTSALWWGTLPTWHSCWALHGWFFSYKWCVTCRISIWAVLNEEGRLEGIPEEYLLSLTGLEYYKYHTEILLIVQCQQQYINYTHVVPTGCLSDMQWQRLPCLPVWLLFVLCPAALTSYNYCPVTNPKLPCCPTGREQNHCLPLWSPTCWNTLLSFFASSGRTRTVPLDFAHRWCSPSLLSATWLPLCPAGVALFWESHSPKPAWLAAR